MGEMARIAEAKPTRVGDDARRSDFVVDAATILLVLVLEGQATAVFDAVEQALTPAVATLFAREGVVEIVSDTGSSVLKVPVARAQVQAHASTVYGGARRLFRTISPLTGDPQSLLARQMRCHDEADADELLVALLVEALVAQHGLDAALPKSRSISLAKAQLDEGAADCWSVEEIARRAGVTPLTLQRGFRTCLGTTVAEYARIVRMQEARLRLASRCESRSIADMAEAFGFASARGFTRAYERAFGETPTQTRSRSVRFESGFHVESAL